MTRVDLTKYGQPPHNASPFGLPSERPSLRQKAALGAAVPRIALVQLVIAGDGIANAPTAISRLRV